MSTDGTHWFVNGKKVNPPGERHWTVLEQVQKMCGASGRLVLFDGRCRLCMGFVDIVVARDPQGVFKFAPLQSELGQRVLEFFGFPPDLDSVVLIRNGEAFIKSEAALNIIGELRGPLSAMYGFKVLPRVLRDFGYEIVAKSRYSLLGHSSIANLESSAKGRLLDHWEPSPDDLPHMCSGGA
eukprot:TRINITY_DN24092_c0_g1_i1.p1 TRINITY_DN24092_c0_g1~~TRINITY_DN24092_c0_g1_i1.p1  ORF type:complete len:182 (+),score=50.88 TRINITY_DN24092_c0_g1_i1:94-639(+)